MSTTNNIPSNALQVLGLDSTSIAIADEAREERDRLLSLARRGKIITDGAGASRAAEILKELKAFTRGIESARKDVKAPVLALTAKIDGLAKELTTDLETEAARIAGLIGAWQKAENDKAEEARRAAYAEEQRIVREAAAKEREELERQEKRAAQARAEHERIEAALRIEAARVQAELAAKADRARTEAGRQKALAEAERQRELAAIDAEILRVKTENDAKAAAEQARQEGMKRDEAEAIAIGKAHASAAVVVAAKPQGIAARRDVEFTVEDIQALYEACPMLVKLEPKTAMIKSALKDLPEGKSLPGVKHWFTSSAVVR